MIKTFKCNFSKLAKYELIPHQRYTHTPAYKNTFVNFYGT